MNNNQMEIERRWLLPSIPEEIKTNLHLYPSVSIRQWYITKKPVLRIRHEYKPYNGKEQFWITIKTKPKTQSNKDIGNVESNIEISSKEFNNLLDIVSTHPIFKTRYFIETDDPLLYAELDVFHSDDHGLIVVEVEFSSEEMAKHFTPPSWFGDNEITGVEKYSNASLAKDLK